eukprot:13735310-Ditylum_brightwellii.AAC.1
MSTALLVDMLVLAGNGGAVATVLEASLVSPLGYEPSGSDLCRGLSPIRFNTIIPSSSPPWQCCTVVGSCCHCPGSKTSVWRQQCRGFVVQAKLQQTTSPPVSLMHWEHNIGEEGGGGGVGEAMVQKK